MTKTIAFLLTVLALAGGSTLFGQRTRPGAAAPRAEKVEIINDVDPEADFATNGLPEPVIIGLNPSDNLAATLARNIANYDDRSLPLLIATLQKAGFYIIDKNEKILYSPVSGDGIGLAFYDFEVAGMLKASKLGTVTTLAKLTDIISTETKDLTSAEMSDAILRDLRSPNGSQNPQVRFAVSLIFEFGKTFPKPVDLKTVSPQNAVINIIQASLIERLILGDLLTAYGAFMEQTSVFRQRELFRRPDVFGFFNAAYTGRVDSECPNIDDLSKLKKYSKNLEKVVKTINIFRVLATKWGVNVKDIKLPGADMSGGKFKDFAKGISKANAVLSWMKLVVGMMRLKAKIEVQDPMPLERVKHTLNPGGTERSVTAQFTMDIPDSESINCAGKVLGLATGLSFSVPKNGPFSDKPVTWEIVANGTRETKYTDTPVYIRSNDDKHPDVSKQMTNGAGESTIVLTGKPQKVNMTNLPVIPLPKHVDLRLSIAMEKMKLGDDAPKLAGFFAGLVSADPLAVFSIIPEVLSKIKFSTFGTRIPVRDWQPCTEDWGGEITYKRVLAKTIVVQQPPASRTENSTGGGVRQIVKSDEAIIILNPRQPEEIKQKPPNPADIIARGRYIEIFEGRRVADPCCGPEAGTYHTSFRSGEEESYSHVIQRIVPIYFRGTERDYTLGIDFYADMMTSKKRSFYEIIGTTCPEEYNESKSEESEGMVGIQASLPQGRHPDRFVNSAGELLKGTKTFLDAEKATVTWEWSLARCTF